MNSSKRTPAADLIRILAFFFVVSVHFLLNNGFYSQLMMGKRMLVMTIMRALFMNCVPLFLTLSGYLLCKKQLSGKYYSKLLKIILTYVLASFACMGYAMIAQRQLWPFKEIILKLLDFTGAPYSWYIEMYIGLFLLIPFLNILYNNIPSQKWKLCLVITFIVLTSLPSVVNEYNLHSLSWWKQPSSAIVANKIIPAWWVGFYPLTYYFIGCYLREYGLRIKRLLNLILLLGVTLLAGIYSWWRSYGSVFIWGAWSEYQSLFNMALTVLVFAFFINLNYERSPAKLNLFIQRLSELCLGAYLLSWIFDNKLYQILLERVPFVIYRLEYYIIIVPLVFVLSLLASFLLSKIQLCLEKLFSIAYRFIIKKTSDRNLIPQN